MINYNSTNYRQKSLISNLLLVLTFFQAFCNQLLNYTLNNSIRYIHAASCYILMFASIFSYIIMKTRKRKPFTFHTIELAIIGMVSYQFIVSAFYGRIDLKSIKDIMIWPTLFLVYYNLYDHIMWIEKAKDNSIIQIKALINKRLCVLLFCLHVLMSYFLIRRYITEDLRAGGRIFPVYFSLTLFPLLLMHIKLKLSVCILSFPLIVISITSTKRSLFLAVCAGLLLYSISRIKKKSFPVLICSIPIIAFVVIVVYNFFLNDALFDMVLRLGNVLKDGGSGRITLYRTIWNEYSSGSFAQQIFGRGYHAVESEAQAYNYVRLAHNDYLEALFDYGLPGVILLITFVMFLIMQVKRIKKIDHNLYSVGIFTLPSLLLLSAVSYLTVQSMIINYLMIFYGIVVGGNHAWRRYNIL